MLSVPPSIHMHQTIYHCYNCICHIVYTTPPLLHERMLTNIHTFIHPSIHACMHACIHTYIHTYIYKAHWQLLVMLVLLLSYNINIYKHANNFKHVICAPIHTHASNYLSLLQLYLPYRIYNPLIYTNVCLQTYIHSSIHPSIHACMHTYIHTYTKRIGSCW